MSIFNSLGSNYNLRFVLNRLFLLSNAQYPSKLTNYLEEKYDGKAILTYKGREAIRLALRASNLKGTTVAICGFTCFAVFEAIEKEGYNTEYLDIEKNSLNFSADTLEKALKKNPKIKIVMIQNTLGFTCDIKNILKICRENNLILIEDLAHSIGAIYNNGSEAGTVGDFVILSFSQDKLIDNVSGGALVIRNNKFLHSASSGQAISNFQFPIINNTQQIKDKFYPLITYKIRKMYALGIGKLLHEISKAFNLLSKPMNYTDSDNLHALPKNYSAQIYSQFLSFENNLKHRRSIAEIYKNTLDKELLSEKICSDINSSSNLRFPIFTESRQSLIEELKKNNIYVSDIWYDAPISPIKYLKSTDYKDGLCPNSEFVSKRILNLPTHINTSESDARKIAERINEWLKSQ